MSHVISDYGSHYRFPETEETADGAIYAVHAHCLDSLDSINLSC